MVQVKERLNPVVYSRNVDSGGVAYPVGRKHLADERHVLRRLLSADVEQSSVIGPDLQVEAQSDRPRSGDDGK